MKRNAGKTDAGNTGGELQPGEMTPEEAAFALQLRMLLREGEERLDFNTAARLSAARARAVAAARPAGLRRLWPWSGAAPWTAAVPTLAAVVFAIGLGANWHRAPGPEGTATIGQTALATPPVELLEQLGAEDAPPADDDELDFAQWLAQQPAVAGSS